MLLSQKDNDQVAIEPSLIAKSRHLKLGQILCGAQVVIYCHHRGHLKTLALGPVNGLKADDAQA